MKRLVVSPHPDDALLSAFGAISSANSTIVTVFAGTPAADQPLSEWDRQSGASDPASQAQQRLNEDRAATRLAGAACIHLNFLDHSYRGPESFSGLLRDEIERIADDFDEVWLPAGIGGHPDHMIIAQLINRLRGSFDLFVYADLPYAQHEWGIKDSANSAGNAPMLEDILRTCQFGPFVKPAQIVLNSAQLARKTECLQQYVSQIKGITLSFDSWSINELDRTEWFWPIGRAPERQPPIDLMYRTLGLSPVSHKLPTPTFTVVMRTQGLRQRELGEALASLAAQTYHHFDVVVLYHNADETHLGQVKSAIANLPGWLAQNTRLIMVRDGSRSRPLNAGLSHRRGEYVTFLDDDDFARENWLAEFARMARHHPGMVLRSRVAEVFVGTPAATKLFPEDYDFLAHLESNWTPLNGIAIPLYKLPLGLEFNEALPVVEDWDFLLRAVELLGIACSSAVTAEYRRWPGGSNSKDVSPLVEWRTTEEYVRVRADSRFILMPPGSASAIRATRAQAARHHASQEMLRLEADKTSALTAHNQALTDELNSTTAELNSTTAELNSTTAELNSTTAKLTSATDQLNVLRLQLQSIESSRSWRLTAWLRTAASMWYRLRQ